MTDHGTAAMLTKAERDELAVSAAALIIEHHRSDVPPGVTAYNVIDSVIARLAAQPPQDDPQPDEREALRQVLRRCPECGHDWSGHVDPPLPFLACRGQRGLGSVSGCCCTNTQTDAVLAAGFRRDPDAGLRERVEAVLAQMVRSDSLWQHDLRAALAEPTPGSES